MDVDLAMTFLDKLANDIRTTPDEAREALKWIDKKNASLKAPSEIQKLPSIKTALGIIAGIPPEVPIPPEWPTDEEAAQCSEGLRKFLQGTEKGRISVSLERDSSGKCVGYTVQWDEPTRQQVEKRLGHASHAIVSHRTVSERSFISRDNLRLFSSMYRERTIPQERVGEYRQLIPDVLGRYGLKVVGGQLFDGTAGMKITFEEATKKQGLERLGRENPALRAVLVRSKTPGEQNSSFVFAADLSLFEAAPSQSVAQALNYGSLLTSNVTGAPLVPLSDVWGIPKREDVSGQERKFKTFIEYTGAQVDSVSLTYQNNEWKYEITWKDGSQFETFRRTSPGLAGKMRKVPGEPLKSVINLRRLKEPQW